LLAGYNTNGFAHHRLEDALRILAQLGYQSVALTLDHQALNPLDPATARQVPAVRDLLAELGLRVVVETGARFLLDPWHKHQPTLLSPAPAERQRRLGFLQAAVELAGQLSADAVSFWSGSPVQPAPAEELMDRLAAGCRQLCHHADAHDVRLAFEPEPGMFIDRMDRFAQLVEQVEHPRFGLTLDIGHLYCLGEAPVRPHVLRWQQRLWNVHLEDMRPGVHEHLMFGEGEVDLAEALAALAEAGYSGGVHVELSRHGHDAVATARRALACLRAAWPAG
jgi:L-ribulose-5-phosphate 3-epimerase